MELLAFIKVLSIGYFAGGTGLSLAAAAWRPVRHRLAPGQRADVSFAIFAGGSLLLVVLTLFIWWGVVNHLIRMTTSYFHHLMHGGWAAGIAGAGSGVLLLSVLLALAAWKRARLPALQPGQRLSFEGRDLVLSNRLTTAGLVGVLSPEVWVNPEYWNGLSDSERRLALHHEQLHRRRRDNLRKLVLQFIASLWFVLPWLRALPGQYELDCELAVDDRCRAELPESEYCSLVGRGAQFALQVDAVPVASGMSNSDLSSRLLLLTQPRILSRRSAGVAATVFALAISAAPLLALLSTTLSRCLVACYLGY